MPRIEIHPIDEPDNGIATAILVDLCHNCSANFVAGQPMPVRTHFNGELHSPDSDRVGSTNVPHPSYNTGDFSCEICGRILNERQDGGGMGS